MNILNEDLIFCAKNIPEKFYNSSFFITGSTGLIGSILIKSILKTNELFNSNIKIFALIRNKDKAKEVFGDLIHSEYLNLVIGDIQNEIHIDNTIDYIIHAASQTASKEMITYPVETSKISLIGTLNILDFAVAKNVKGIVYLSSMEAFGICNNDTNRLKEENLGYIDLKNIRSCYSESKRMCELLSACYAKEYNLNVYNARLAQVFGAGITKNENRVFAQFTRSALKGEDIILHTDGTSWGNYCYTADVINALFTILDKGQTGETYTVVNEETSIMIKDMANLVIDIVNTKKSKVIFDIPENNQFGYAPKTVMKLSSEKMQNLGWKPYFSLKNMYQRLIQYMKEMDD